MTTEILNWKLVRDQQQQFVWLLLYHCIKFAPQNAMSTVNNLVRLSVNAYPNPFDKLLILYPDVDIENVKMMTLDGKVIHSVNNLACGNTHHINTEKIPSGVYIVSATNNGVSNFLKLLKN